MMTVQDIDLTGLNKFVYELHKALAGTGQGGDLNKLLATEGGQLAWETAEQLGPASRSAANKKIEKDVKRFLTPLPAYSNLSPEQQESNYADFTWLSAGKTFLLGINDEDNRRDASVSDAIGFYYAGAKTGSRGNAYVQIGKRGHQPILRLNRTRVTRATFNAVQRSIKDKVGQLKASFAYAASRLIPSKRVPEWVRRQFPEVLRRGKAIFDAGQLLDPRNPSITIGSRAKGVESNVHIRETFRRAGERRKFILRDKLQKIWAGYAYDWANGKTFRAKEFTLTE